MSSQKIHPDLMYRLLVQGVNDYAIYLLDKDGIVLNWNTGAERAKGYSANEIIGRNYDCFYSPEDRASGVPQRNLELTLQRGHYATQGWRYRKDGTAFWASVALDAIYDDGVFLGFAKVTRDLTEQRASAKRLEYQALHDTLTDLPNRAALTARLERELPKVIYGSRIALHYIDLDRFKPVNDSFGHHVGDEVLREVARRLMALAGSTNHVSRIGGDEFALLQLGSPSPNCVTAMAGDIIAVLNEAFQFGDNTVNIGASVGVATAPNDGVRLAILLRNADLALYSAKASGRNRACFYASSLGEAMLARRILEENLRGAVEAKDFTLVYQPIVNGATGCRIGFEALLRWVDRTGRQVPPSDFIPIAEELGLMADLGRWVLRAACQEAVSWADGGTIAVNLSATQLSDPNLPDIVGDALTETGLSPERLELEITETAVLGNRDVARGLLQQLREIGVGIALDDFGTGFSSLSLVRELPLTRIKIDRSFVADIDGTMRSVAVIKAVVALAQGYDLALTGEGIETEEQRDTLLAHGCGDLQGYLLGRPAPAAHWRTETGHRSCR